METIEKLVSRAIVNGKLNYNALKKIYFLDVAYRTSTAHLSFSD
jgi:hypothetical protein